MISNIAFENITENLYNLSNYYQELQQEEDNCVNTISKDISIEEILCNELIEKSINSNRNTNVYIQSDKIHSVLIMDRNLSKDKIDYTIIYPTKTLFFSTIL